MRYTVIRLAKDGGALYQETGMEWKHAEERFFEAKMSASSRVRRLVMVDTSGFIHMEYSRVEYGDPWEDTMDRVKRYKIHLTEKCNGEWR